MRCMGAHSRVSSLCIVSRKTFWTNWHTPVCDSIKECYCMCVLLLARGGNGRFPCIVQAIARTMTVYRGTIFVSGMSSKMWMYDLILWWLAWTWNSKYRGSTMARILYDRCSNKVLSFNFELLHCHTNIVTPTCYIVIPTLPWKPTVADFLRKHHCVSKNKGDIRTWALGTGDSWVDHVGLWTGFGNFSKYKSTLDTATLNPKCMPDNDDLTCWKNDDCCSVFLGGQSWRFRFVPFWSFKFKKGAGKNWRELPPPYSCELVQQKIYICAIVHCTKWQVAKCALHKVAQCPFVQCTICHRCQSCTIVQSQNGKLPNCAMHKLPHCQFVIAQICI